MKGANGYVCCIEGTGNKKVEGLSDENLVLLIEMIDRYMKPEQTDCTSKKRIGIKKGKKMYADGYDFDEMNEQIAAMFGGKE